MYTKMISLTPAYHFMDAQVLRRCQVPPEIGTRLMASEGGGTPGKGGGGDLQPLAVDKGMLVS